MLRETNAARSESEDLEGTQRAVLDTCCKAAAPRVNGLHNESTTSSSLWWSREIGNKIGNKKCESESGSSSSEILLSGPRRVAALSPATEGSGGPPLGAAPFAGMPGAEHYQRLLRPAGGGGGGGEGSGGGGGEGSGGGGGAKAGWCIEQHSQIKLEPGLKARAYSAHSLPCLQPIALPWSTGRVRQTDDADARRDIQEVGGSAAPATLDSFFEKQHDGCRLGQLDVHQMSGEEWFTVGVLVKKAGPFSSAKGTEFVKWELSDLRHSKLTLMLRDGEQRLLPYSAPSLI